MDGVEREAGERVRVLASFAPKKIRIHFFSWRERTYKVDSVNLFHIAKDNDRNFYHFAVSAAGNSYLLIFDPVTLEWKLVEVIDE